jgi:hypothetical protein
MLDLGMGSSRISRLVEWAACGVGGYVLPTGREALQAGAAQSLRALVQVG